MLRPALVIASLAFNSVASCFGASVTVITHGFQFNNNYPAWVDSMATEVQLRAGPNAAVYRMEIDWPMVQLAPSVSLFKLDSGVPVSQFTKDCDIIVKVFWHRIAGYTDTASATDIASAVVPYLTNPISMSNSETLRAFAELPFHLIGHSRGSAVVAEIGRLLGDHGLWVDHLTTIDPHPLSDADCSLFGIICPLARDPAIRLFNNIVFADNYFQQEIIPPLQCSPYIAGYSISGATELLLNGRFRSDGIPCVVEAPHSKTHDWYHGTIRGAAGYPGWYRTNDLGFRYSLLAGGQGLRRIINPNYSREGLRWNGAPRIAWNPTSPQWSNVELETTNRFTSVFVGQSFPLILRFENFSPNTIVFVGIDSDRNPYNQSPSEAFFSITNAITGKVIVTNVVWMPRVATPEVYVWAAVGNGIRSRIYYLTEKFQVLVAPKISDIALRIDGNLEIGVTGSIGRRYEVLASDNLMRWLSLGSLNSERFTIDATFVRENALAFFRLRFD